jgi:hypothetical protein
VRADWPAFSVGQRENPETPTLTTGRVYMVSSSTLFFTGLLMCRLQPAASARATSSSSAEAVSAMIGNGLRPCSASSSRMRRAALRLSIRGIWISIKSCVVVVREKLCNGLLTVLGEVDLAELVSQVGADQEAVVGRIFRNFLTSKTKTPIY